MKRKIYLTTIWSITFLVILISLLAHNGMFPWFDDSGETISDTLTMTPFTSIDMDIAFADLKFEYNNNNEYIVTYEVSSNRLIPKINWKDDTLYVTQKKTRRSGTQDSFCVLTLSVPEGTCFDKVILDVGIGDLNVRDLTAQKLDLDAGVGDLDILACEIKDAVIDVGVGDVQLSNDLITRLELYAGVGNVSIDGVGDMSDYTLNIDLGVGALSINGETKNGLGKNYSQSGNGECSYKIDAGMGDVSISEN